jgi:hypothetical protein
MPFKSKAQQRFMFAAEDRGKMPQGTAKRWADHTPSIKKLPEYTKKKDKTTMLRKMAFDLGKVLALNALREQFDPPLAKTAGLPPGAADMFMHYLPYVGGPAVGAYLAGPGYRLEGGLAGFGAAHVAKNIARGMGAKKNPALSKYLEAGHTPEQIMTGLHSGAEGFKGLDPSILKNLNNYELGGALLGGGAGGLATGRLMGAQNPYGLQPVFSGVGKENPTGQRDPSDTFFGL